MKEAKILLEITKCFLWEKDYLAYKDVDEEKLYQLAKMNHLSNFLENWMQKYGKSEKIKNKIDQDYTTQIVKDTNYTFADGTLTLKSNLFLNLTADRTYTITFNDDAKTTVQFTITI